MYFRILNMIKYIKKETNIVIKLAKAPCIAKRILVAYVYIYDVRTCRCMENGSYVRFCVICIFWLRLADLIIYYKSNFYLWICEALAAFNRLRQARRLAQMLGHVSDIADVAWYRTVGPLNIRVMLLIHMSLILFARRISLAQFKCLSTKRYRCGCFWKVPYYMQLSLSNYI